MLYSWRFVLDARRLYLYTNFYHVSIPPLRSGRLPVPYWEWNDLSSSSARQEYLRAALEGA